MRGKGKRIDWWRYQSKILIPPMIPFAEECMKTRPETVVQEDKAPHILIMLNSMCMTSIRSADFFGVKIRQSECDRALLGIFKKENYKEWRPKEPSRGYTGLGGSLKRASTKEDPRLDRKNPCTCPKSH